jgi:hydroxymethylbilane synthase
LGELLNDNESALRVTAERTFMKTLEGGCKLPIGVYSEINGETLTLVGEVWHPFRRLDQQYRATIEGPLANAVSLGEQLAQ